MKLDIRRKVLLLVLSGSLLTFLLVNIFLYFGLYRIRETVETKNEELGEEAAEYTGQMVEAEIKKRMGEITRLRAKHVDLGLMATAADVIYIVDVMNTLLKNGVQSSAEPLPNALYVDVPAGLPYIHYSPDFVRQGVSPALQREIRMTSGFIGSLLGMSKYSDYYQAVYLGSKNGYTIMAQKKEEEQMLSDLCTETFRHTYDPRKQNWYILGKDASKPVFTDVYTNPVTGEANVSNASFLGRVQDVAEQLDAVEQFALSWGADAHCCNSLRLAMEEICGVMNERAGSLKGDEPVLAQLTVIAQEDGTFKLHLRDNAKELNPFRLSAEQANLESKPIEDIDVRALGLHAVKTHVRQYLYRNYHGFNTITLTV